MLENKRMDIFLQQTFRAINSHISLTSEMWTPHYSIKQTNNDEQNQIHVQFKSILIKVTGYISGRGNHA